ncbi:MAG TPA: hypothetical protein VFH38_06525 [Jatrophihabitans sp.]|nr:hypothetical protein [Jatrophihabitans sp.]
MTGTPTVFIHIGAPKTGTTFLQNVFWHNKQALKKDGVLVPGRGRRGHVAETFDLRNMGFRGHRLEGAKGAWDRMVAQVRDWDGRVIIDQELLSGATEEQVDRALSSLSFADVHIVYTARDMARQLPAAWQEWIKNQESTTYTDFLAGVRDPEAGEPRVGKQFWRLYDSPGILARWARNVDPAHVHVITVPPPGADRDILWHRFAGLVGIDPQRYQTEFDSANASLAAPEATVLRLLNQEIGGDQFPWPTYDRFIKHGVAPALGRRKGEKIDLPQDVHDWAVNWSRELAKYVESAGFDVIGDTDELVPTARPSGVNPDHAPLEDQLAAAIAGMAVVVNLQTMGASEAHQQLHDAQRQLIQAQRKLREHEELRPADRIKRCLIELSEQVGWLGALYGAFKRVRRRQPTES